MNGDIMHHNETKKFNNKLTVMATTISNNTGTAL